MMHAWCGGPLRRRESPRARSCSWGVPCPWPRRGIRRASRSRSPSLPSRPSIATCLRQSDARRRDLHLACDSGDADSCGELSRLYDAGRGVPRSLSMAAALRAAGLYMEACDADDGAACTDLGFLYLRGFGVRADHRRAAALFEQACDLGIPRGCHDLGVVRWRGAGVDRSPTGAVSLFRKACDAGDPRGCTALATALHRGVGIAADPKAARTLYRRACEAGDPDGCAADAILTLGGGHGDEAAAKAAASRLERACDDGSAHACQHLGGMLRDGRIVERDAERALRLFIRACDAEHADGCRQLSALSAARRRTLPDGARLHPLYLGDDTSPVDDPATRRDLEKLIRECARGLATACRALGTHGGVHDPGF